MTTPDLITQCPFCNTRFHVTLAQLQAAQGAVRCGTCKQVFNASLYLDSKPVHQPAAAGQPLPAQTDSPQNQDLHIRPADALLAYEEPEDLQLSARKDDTADATDSGLDAMLTGLDTQDDFSPRPVRKLKHRPARAHQAEPEVEVLPPEEQEPYIGAFDEESSNSTALIVTRREPGIFSDFDDWRDQPVYLGWRPSRPSFSWGWALLCVLALAGLGGQFLYYNFDSLAGQPQHRVWLEKLCLALDCSLPNKVDVSQISSSNLVVRNHAQYRNALTVDAIIYNRAAYDQPFPLLVVNFTNAQKQLLASRIFTPHEYLAGELAGRSSMPSQTPVHIALDVMIPHKDTAGYSIAFQSPE